MNPDQKSRWIKVTENTSGKTVSLNFDLGKKIVFWFIVIILGIITAIVLFSPELRVNREVVQAGLITRSMWMIYPWLAFLAFYYLLYFPLSITITRKLDGSFEVNKRDWFFNKSHYTLNVNQNPRMIARHRRMVGFTVFIPTVYQPIIRYHDGGVDHDINLIFTASYFMKGIGPRAVFKKEEMEEISRQTGLPLIVED
jgi:hypothetical protein